MKGLVAERVKKHIKTKGEGWVFSPADFGRISPNKVAVEKELSRLAQEGSIKRIRRGVYYFPKINQLWGAVPPEPEAVVQAICRGMGMKCLPSGALSANRLGLSTQVPAKLVFHTERNIAGAKIGGTVIEFKGVAPSKMSGSEGMAGVILNAIEYLGREEVSEPGMKRKLAEKIARTDFQNLERAAKSRPQWIRNAVHEIVCEEIF